MQDMTKEPFDKQAGIRIQTQQLKRWETVLLPHVFKKLQQIVTKDNDEATNGYDVVRGHQMDEIIYNQLMNKA
jgi:hypothetical protein